MSRWYGILLFVALIYSFIENVSCAADKIAHILESTYKNDGTGNYFFRFSTSNGITRVEYGKLDETNAITVGGYYSYKDKESVRYTVYYKADKNGYRVLKTEAKKILTGDDRISSAALASLVGGGLG